MKSPRKKPFLCTLLATALLLTSCQQTENPTETIPEIDVAQTQIEEQAQQRKQTEYQDFYDEFVAYTYDFSQLEENLWLTREYITDNPQDPQGLSYQMACLDQMIALLQGFSQLKAPEELISTYELFQSTCTYTINAVRACQESLTEDLTLEDLADNPDYQDIVLAYVNNYQDFATNLIHLYQLLEEQMALYS